MGETVWSTYLASERPFLASAIFYVDSPDLSFPLEKAHVKGCNNDGSGITYCSEMGREREREREGAIPRDEGHDKRLFESLMSKGLEPQEEDKGR